MIAYDHDELLGLLDDPIEPIPESDELRRMTARAITDLHRGRRTFRSAAHWIEAAFEAGHRQGREEVEANVARTVDRWRRDLISGVKH